MILINSNNNVEEIEKDYTKKVLNVFMERIKILKKVIKLLESKTPITEDQLEYNEFRVAIKAVLNDSSIKSNSKKNLCANIEKKRNKNKARTNKVKKDLKIYDDEKILHKIISAHPSELKFEQSTLQCKLNYKEGDELIYYLFNYDFYYDDYIVPIAQDLDVNVCPYCNRNFITHIQTKGQKRIIGPTFDHFFHQAENPFLTLSFYNLIPSCSICNSNLKNQKRFYIETHWHPYMNEAANSFQFDYTFTTVKKNGKAKIVFTPTIKNNVKKGTKQYKLMCGDERKNTGSLNVFKIKEIYAAHHDIVEEVHTKFDETSPHYVKSITEKLKKLGCSEDEFYRFHFGNYYNPKDFGKRPLAKLTKDIYLKLHGIRPLFD